MSRRRTGASPASRAASRNLPAASCNKREVNAAPDAGLVASTLDGDEGAFTLLVDRHRGRIRSVAHGVLGDWAEAEDVTQEALLAAHATLARLRDPERFGAWLAAIAVNLARMRLRSRRGDWTSLDELAGGVLGPSPAATDESDLVREALHALSGLQREAVLLHYVEGLDGRNRRAARRVAGGRPRSPASSPRPVAARAFRSRPSHWKGDSNDRGRASGRDRAGACGGCRE